MSWNEVEHPVHKSTTSRWFEEDFKDPTSNGRNLTASWARWYVLPRVIIATGILRDYHRQNGLTLVKSA